MKRTIVRQAFLHDSEIEYFLCWLDFFSHTGQNNTEFSKMKNLQSKLFLSLRWPLSYWVPSRVHKYIMALCVYYFSRVCRPVALCDCDLSSMLFLTGQVVGLCRGFPHQSLAGGGTGHGPATTITRTWYVNMCCLLWCAVLILFPFKLVFSSSITITHSILTYPAEVEDNMCAHTCLSCVGQCNVFPVSHEISLIHYYIFYLASASVSAQ